jgi:broad specificity phosphatase PhoE
MELIFIRHGQPAWSVEGWSQIDPHLTDLGNRQAQLAAARLASERSLTELLASPANRAQETALPIAERTGLPLHTVDDIVEIRMPDWSGELEETVQRIFAASMNRDPDDWWEGLPGGESFREFHNRVTASVRNLLADRGITPDPRHKHLWHVSDDSHRIAIVAHGGTNAVALTYLLGVEPAPWEWERFILYHASFARLRAIPLAGEHVFSLRTFNDREHLPGDMRTR